MRSVGFELLSVSGDGSPGVRILITGPALGVPPPREPFLVWLLPCPMNPEKPSILVFREADNELIGELDVAYLAALGALLRHRKLASCKAQYDTARMRLVLDIPDPDSLMRRVVQEILLRGEGVPATSPPPGGPTN